MTISATNMQRLGSLSILQKLSVGTRSWGYQRRPYSRPPGRFLTKEAEAARRDTCPLVDLSPLLFDLDAEGAEGVRTFDPQLDGVPEKKQALNDRQLLPLKGRIAEFEERYQECESNFMSLCTDKFHPLRIGDFDFLVATLLGAAIKGPKARADSRSALDSSALYDTTLDSVLHTNGIPCSARDYTEAVIKYMQRRQALSHGHTPPEPEDEVMCRLAFVRCQTFSEIERLVARLNKTRPGCRILSSVSNELYESVARVTERPSRALSLLNNLLISLDRHGLHVDAKLYDLGIRASLKCQAITTAQQYIKRKLDHGSYDDAFTEFILNTLLQDSIESSPFTSHKTLPTPSNRLAMVFSLLTGYVPGEEEAAVSLRSLITNKASNNFRLYIQLLARLGAFRTIWHEWHATEPKSSGTGFGTNRASAFGETNHFIKAILDALARNSDIVGMAGLPEFTTVTGDFREDCTLDMVAISKWADILASPGKDFQEPAHVYVKRWDDLHDIFRQGEMETVFPALQKFLMQTTSFS